MGTIMKEGPFADTTAAWVQTVGTLIALWITVAETRRLQRAERERIAAPLEIARQASRNALLYYDAFEKGIEGKDVRAWANSHIQPAAVDSVLAPFREVSLKDMPSPEAVELLIEARMNAEFLVERIRAAAQGAPKWQDGSVITRTRMWHAWASFDRERDRILGRPLRPWPFESRDAAEGDPTPP
ncbi:hypothetical protein [Phenylobacterium sp.]|uniref:hypothetical protein n=1 Tax=Phenylobacterium sp. TaxID=1871053 RepID=UPI00281289AD|nr:hypothetical protein [Phenylobacterium sp.]